MTRIRLLLATIVSILLTAGYLASQLAFKNGSAAEYATKVDQAPVVLLSLGLFILAVIFLFLPDKETEN